MTTPTQAPATASLFAGALVEYKSAGRPNYAMLEDYREGRQVLRYASRDVEPRIGALLDGLRENLCAGVVGIFADALRVASWGESVSEQQTEELNTLVGRLATHYVGEGDVYVIVWYGPAGERVAHVRNAARCVPLVDPRDPTQLAALTDLWIDPSTGYARAVVYTSTHAERWISAAAVPLTDTATGKSGTMPAKLTQWRPYDDHPDGGGAAVPHDFGAVPGVWARRGDHSSGYGESMLHDVIPLQDALNKSLADLVLVSDAYAEPLYGLLGSKRTAGAILNPYAATPDGSAGGSTDPNPDIPRHTGARMFETDATGPFVAVAPPDMRHVLAQQDAYVGKIARVVGFPGYMLTQEQGDTPSGIALRILKGRFVASVEAMHTQLTPLMRGMCELLGMPGASPVWVAPQQLDPLELAELAQVQDSLGYSLTDTAHTMGSEDVEGVVLRAEVARATDAAALGAAIRRDPTISP